MDEAEGAQPRERSDREHEPFLYCSHFFTSKDGGRIDVQRTSGECCAVVRDSLPTDPSLPPSLQALESIFLDDFTKLSSTHVTIKLIPLQGEGDDVNFVGVTLDVNIPETYPEVEPEIDVVLDKGEGVRS